MNRIIYLIIFILLAQLLFYSKLICILYYIYENK